MCIFAKLLSKDKMCCMNFISISKCKMIVQILRCVTTINAISKIGIIWIMTCLCKSRFNRLSCFRVQLVIIVSNELLWTLQTYWSDFKASKCKNYNLSHHIIICHVQALKLRCMTSNHIHTFCKSCNVSIESICDPIIHYKF